MAVPHAAGSPTTDQRTGLLVAVTGVTVLSFGALLVRLAGAAGWRPGRS